MPHLQIRPTSAEIDLGALRHNLRVVKRAAGAGVGVCAVAKANAYGHGLVRVCLELEREGVPFLGVNSMEEALELREAGVAAELLVMGGVFADAHRLVARERLTPVVCRRDDLQAFARVAGDRPLPIHVKFDTGMGRLGFWPEQLGEVLDVFRAHPVLRLDGLMTHLASADMLGHEEEVEAQLAAFARVRAGVAAARFAASRLTLVRPGLLLYGAAPSRESGFGLDLQPVMRVSTEVVHLRDVPVGHGISYARRFVTPRACRIATLPIGYADGIPRRFSPGGAVLVRGQRAPVVGAVCMDMLMVDVTDIPSVSRGDEVVLLGRQGDAVLTAAELADWFDTIPYEVFCSFTARVPRVYRSTEEGI